MLVNKGTVDSRTISISVQLALERSITLPKTNPSSIWSLYLSLTVPFTDSEIPTLNQQGLSSHFAAISQTRDAIRQICLVSTSRSLHCCTQVQGLRWIIKKIPSCTSPYQALHSVDSLWGYTISHNDHSYGQIQIVRIILHNFYDISPEFICLQAANLDSQHRNNMWPSHYSHQLWTPTNKLSPKQELLIS